jgi:RNA polymerase sigma-70 factor, ECF subfamily
MACTGLPSILPGGDRLRDLRVVGRHHRQRAVRMGILCSQVNSDREDEASRRSQRQPIRNIPMCEHADTNRPLSPSDLEDTALIALVASGDRVAFEKLYSAHHHRISRFLARFIRSRESLEEIIDDTFMVVWSNARHFRHSSRLSTWIVGIGYRTALKSLRGTGHQMVSQNIEDLTAVRPDHAVVCEQKDWVGKALNRLPLEQRLILELAYGLGHSIEEIAAITCSPIGTVKTRMFHAREKLRHYLPALGTPRGKRLFRSCDYTL